LFSAKAYELPFSEESADLVPHLTNTCLQADRGEDGVRLLDELVNCDILSLNRSETNLKLSAKDITSIVDQIAEALAEAFKATLENPVHFQVCSYFQSRLQIDPNCSSLCLTPSNFMGLIS
jgi:tubulin--tyrosine ligase